jgi:hypothetical protein
MDGSIKIKLTIMDKIGELITWLSIFTLLFFPVVTHHYSIMFNDLGGGLPEMTKLVMNWWFPHVFAFLAILIMVLRWFPKKADRITTVRIIVIGSFLLSLTGLIFCNIALKLPMIEVLNALSE